MVRQCVSLNFRSIMVLLNLFLLSSAQMRIKYARLQALLGLLLNIVLICQILFLIGEDKQLLETHAILFQVSIKALVCLILLVKSLLIQICPFAWAKMLINLVNTIINAILVYFVLLKLAKLYQDLVRCAILLRNVALELIALIKLALNMVLSQSDHS